MKIAWLTDPHLNCYHNDLKSWFDMIHATEADGVVITGDIMTATPHKVTRQTVADFVRDLQGDLSMPTWFVLGNHDYYGSSIDRVRLQLRNSWWLCQQGVVPLTDKTGLIGHDGWADGRSGDFLNSSVMLNDYVQIEELTNLTKPDLLERLNTLGDECANYIRVLLPDALRRFEHVIFATHVPPFRGACWHEGKVSDDDWAPHFTCQAAGEALVDIMAQYPDHTLTVLCGHTHSWGIYNPQANITVITGGADYGRQEVQAIFDPDHIQDLINDIQRKHIK
ncbi:metallophosphoesterase family protein [Magnetococcales bacterium HHB-1]